MGFGDFLSTKWDELTGKNQKVGLGTIGSEYDTAQGTWDADTGTGTGAMGTYGQLQQTGFDMMDPNSARNRAEKARMDSTGADAAAEASRLAGRNATMVGGAPAGALAAQTQAGANTAQAGSNQAYNQYLTGQFGQGMGMVSGAANNMASMGMNRMNAVSNQRQANAMIDSQATGFGANMLGKGLGMFNPGGMGVTLAGKLAAYGKQNGGFLSLTEGGMPRGGQDALIDWISRQRDPQNNVPMPEAGVNYRAEFSDDLESPDEAYERSGEEDRQMLRKFQIGYDEQGLPMRQDIVEDDFGDYQDWNPPQDVNVPQGYQQGGYTRNTGGMLSQIMGPDGIPMHIRTRIGGQTVG